MVVILKHINNYKIELLILSIVVLYIIFPTNNSTLDAYGYATSIKYDVDLFESHHLLYNAFQYIISKTLLSMGLNFDVLSMTKVVNSIFQFFNLYISYQIFKLFKTDKSEIILYILIIGFSYSSIRFGTENENYIIPITFSLLASYFYLRFIKTESVRMIFYSGLFASIASLFHQIHFFWWFGIFIGVVLYIKKWRFVFYYIISAIIVPIIYLAVIYFYKNEAININNIFHFVFHDYYTGTAKSEFGINNFIFIIISSVRTFFQVHPVIFSLIKENYFFILPILILPILLFILIKLLFKKRLFLTTTTTTIFVKSHIIIFIIHFLFSFYAVGNVEFMVMLPFLMFISIFKYYKINKLFLKVFTVSLLIWNFSYGLLANNMFKFYNDNILIDFIISHPNDVFFVSEHTVINKYSYKTGNIDVKYIKRKKTINSIKALKKINSREYFYTDIINKPQILNRASMLNTNKINFLNNKKELIKTYKGLYGKSYIYKVYY